MNILVTGAAGFIGFHLCKKLCDNGDVVIGIDNFDNYYDVKLKKDRIKILEKHTLFRFHNADIRYSQEVNDVFIEQALRDEPIQKVCHLAAVAGVRHSINNPKLYIETNINGFQNVIEIAKAKDVLNFVYASSSSVYGNNGDINKERD